MVQFLAGLRYAFPPPNIIQLVIGRLVKWGGKLIMITPFWIDHSWFPYIMRLTTEPPRRLQPPEWLLLNATAGEAILKVMREIKLTAWKLLSQSVSGIELWMKQQKKKKKNTDSWQTGIRENYKQMFEC